MNENTIANCIVSSAPEQKINFAVIAILRVAQPGYSTVQDLAPHCLA